MVDSKCTIKNKKYQTFARYFEQLDCTYFALWRKRSQKKLLNGKGSMIIKN